MIRKLIKFGGLLPKLEGEALPFGMAAKCIDVDLSRGILSPFRSDEKRFNVSGKTFYTDGCCLAASDDVCGTFARVYADCDWIVKADDSGVWISLWNCNLNWCRLGFDFELPAPSAQILERVGNNFNQEIRQYYYTVGNNHGWESMPSPVSEVVIASNDLDVVVSGFATDFNSCVDWGRVYCAVSNLDYGDDREKATEFLLVGEFQAGENVFIHKAHTVYGEKCQTEEYQPPPVRLHSLAYSDNGQLGGLSGNELCLSAPFKPYAFPEQYRYGNFRGKPIRFVVSNQIGYVLTDAFPALIDLSGAPSEAGCRDVRIVPIHLPCVSYRSATVYQGGCVYASRDGLVWLNGESARVISLDFWTTQQWQLLNPTTLRGAIVNGWYIGKTDKFCFRFKLPDSVFEQVDNWHLGELSINADNFFVSDNGKMFFINDEGVWEWAAGSNFKPFIWRGALNVSAGFVAWSAFKVINDHAPVRVLHLKRGANRTDDVIISDKVVHNGKPNRLKSGISALEIDVEISGVGSVREYTVATSVAELGAQ